MHQSNIRTKKIFVVAVTGGIASGKTTVCKIFYDLFGIETIDTDSLSREAVSAGSDCLKKIVKIFGEKVLDEKNNLNRPLMKKIVFKDDSLREKLENIVHPEIRKLILKHLSEIADDYCLLGIPLLGRRNQDPNINRILVVDCEEKLQIERAVLRDNLHEDEIKRIIASQASRKKRLALADDVINNKGNPSDLKEDVIKLNRLYRGLSNKK